MPDGKCFHPREFLVTTYPNSDIPLPLAAKGFAVCDLCGAVVKVKTDA